MTFPKHARNPLLLREAERWGITGPVQRQKAVALDGSYGQWRETFHETVTRDGREQDDPFDVEIVRSDNPFIAAKRNTPLHRYKAGSVLALPVGGRVERFRVTECFETGRRLRYRLESLERGQGGWWFAITERQLMRLQHKRAGDFAQKHRRASEIKIIWFGHVSHVK